jgi:hypothetical protein
VASTTSSETGSSDNDGAVTVSNQDKGKDTEDIVKQDRLVDWMVDLLAEHIKQIVSSGCMAVPPFFAV